LQYSRVTRAILLTRSMWVLPSYQCISHNHYHSHRSLYLSHALRNISGNHPAPLANRMHKILNLLLTLTIILNCKGPSSRAGGSFTDRDRSPHLHCASAAMPVRPACVENWNSDSRPEGMKNTTQDLEGVQENNQILS
jgi:hypothetical protein